MNPKERPYVEFAEIISMIEKGLQRGFYFVEYKMDISKIILLILKQDEPFVLSPKAVDREFFMSITHPETPPE